jgi:hypothetical protein
MVSANWMLDYLGSNYLQLMPHNIGFLMCGYGCTFGTSNIFRSCQTLGKESCNWTMSLWDYGVGEEDL